MTDKWLTVAAGLPDEPDTDGMNALCDAPGPGRFFDKLFASLTDASVNRFSPVIESSIRDDDWEFTKGFFGKKDAGLHFAEARCTETSSVDMQCAWEPYGVPEGQVRWEFSLKKAGQFGFAAFHHRTLQVSFSDDTAQALFLKIWEDVFKRTPVFQATALEAISDTLS